MESAPQVGWWVVTLTQVVGVLIIPFVLMALKWAHAARVTEHEFVKTNIEHLEDLMLRMDTKREAEALALQTAFYRIENGLLIRMAATEAKIDSHVAWHVTRTSEKS